MKQLRQMQPLKNRRNLPEIPETDPDKPLEEVDLTDPDALPAYRQIGAGSPGT
jgi:hypothetical protein